MTDRADHDPLAPRTAIVKHLNLILPNMMVWTAGVHDLSPAEIKATQLFAEEARLLARRLERREIT